MTDDVLIVGAGAHARRVGEALEASGWAVSAFAVTSQGDGDGSVVHPADLFPAAARQANALAIVAIGDADARSELAARLEKVGVRLVTVVHPRASVAPSAVVGEGTVILPGAVVDSGARVGRGVIIDAGVVVGHDAVVGAWAHLRPGCVIAPRARVAERGVVDYGAVVREGRD